ncbi:unnamed protein product [Brassica rapa]|uniref:non-specific serine/threonine protein kinase n=1 Tax=Brassica campestris TaxID=3711 RepID=A0A8D9DCB9_BRACM|nr:unnamed protein product [Brassica rapa]
MSCSSSSGSDEEHEGFDAYRKGGYHAVRIGDQFSGGRYIAQRKLGWGQFSTVWLAYDTHTSIATGGARSKDYSDRHGDLKRIRRLKYWPLERLLTDKYKLPEAEAREFADFLCPILAFAPEKRPTAQQWMQHPWLNLGTQNILKLR